MIIVIDGYNLLRAIFPKVKGKLDKQRQQLICQLGHYKKQREDRIKEIVLVFDGGYGPRATREIRQGVVVIFSGQRCSADDWIVDYVDRHKDRELMLVTRDRELIEKCRSRNVGVLKGVDFYKIMQDRLLEGVEKDLSRDVGDGGVKKYEREGDIGEIESASLDLLMEHTSLEEYKKVDKFEEDKKKKGQERKKSKKEKKRLSKLRKL